MTNDHAGMPSMAHRFLGSWKRALGELAIVSLGVLLALWADQTMQTRQEATRADADRILERMRTRPNFEGYLRDSMYWAQLSALLLDGVILSAEQLEAMISEEIEALR